MGIDAASGWILGELEDGEQIPSASNYSEIAVENGCMVNMLLLNIDYYETYCISAAITSRKAQTSPASCFFVLYHQQGTRCWVYMIKLVVLPWQRTAPSPMLLTFSGRN